MTLNKISKTVVFIAFFSMLWGMPNYSSALEPSEINSNVVDSKTDENLTIGEIEKIFQEYLKENNINIEIGTPEYLDYIYAQMLENKDENLSKHPRYNLITSYFTEYIISAQDSYFNNIENQDRSKLQRGSNELTVDSLENKDKTISQIREQSLKEDQEIQQEEQNIKSSRGVSGYSPKSAQVYALTWAKNFNPRYKQYKYDCTNYVSQCLAAGGMKLTKPSKIPGGTYQTSSYWYSHDKWKDSTPWVRVTDFHSYWAPRVRDANYKDSSTVSRNGNIGDVVQFRDAGTLKRWHTMIITDKKNNTVYLSGHTTSRKNYAITNYNDSTTDWSLLDF